MKFRAEEIETRLLADIAEAERDHWAVRYLGWEQGSFAEHLVAPPRSVRFRNGFAVGYRWLRVVLDDLPQSRADGFLVVFDRRELRARAQTAGTSSRRVPRPLRLPRRCAGTDLRVVALAQAAARPACPPAS